MAALLQVAETLGGSPNLPGTGPVECSRATTPRRPTPRRARGGTADEEFDPCYHQACDRLDVVDRVALGRFTDAVDASLRRFASTAGELG